MPELTHHEHARPTVVLRACAFMALTICLTMLTPVTASAQLSFGWGRGASGGFPNIGMGPGGNAGPFGPYPGRGARGPANPYPQRGTGPGWPGPVLSQRGPRRPDPYPSPRPGRGDVRPGRYPPPVWARPVWNRPGRPVVAAVQPMPSRVSGPRRPIPVGPVAPGPNPVPPLASSDPSFLPGEVLFRTAAPQSVEAVDQLVRGYGLTRVAYLPVALTGQTVYRYRITNRRSVDAAVRSLAADARFASVQPNTLYRLQQRNEAATLVRNQYAATKLHLAEAHRLATGDGVLVAVIDSGVDGAHPELAGAISANLNVLASDLKPDGHGTGISAIIAARGQLLGVAPQARLLTIRAFEAASPGRSGGTGTALDLVNAVSMAGVAGARVVNMSFAGPRSPLLAETIAAGGQRGIVFVAAAGNGGAAAPPAYPAAEPGVIAVTATDASDRRFATANRGSYVGLAAPGVDVLVAAPGNAYGFSSGTSVAAAHVTGIVALLLQRDASLTPDAVRDRLASGASDLGSPGHDPDFGAGLVDALRSLTATPAGPGSPAAVTHPEPPQLSPAAGL